MDSLEAEDELARAGAGLSPERLYRLTLAATGSEAKAAAAEQSFRAALLKSGRTPE